MFALAIPWPAVLALIAGLFLAINLLFAALHRLDPASIGGGAEPRATSATPWAASGTKKVTNGITARSNASSGNPTALWPPVAAASLHC